MYRSLITNNQFNDVRVADKMGSTLPRNKQKYNEFLQNDGQLLNDKSFLLSSS